MFLFPDALSDVEDQDVSMREVEARLAQVGFVEVDQDLYTNVVVSMLSPTDIFTTKGVSWLLIIVVACLQCVLSTAILSHVKVAMSWTPASVKRNSMYELYENLRHEGRLSYVRLEQKDVTDLCGDFQYDLEEKGLPGTNWTAYYVYTKVPVNNWHAWDIPPTDRSELDTARFVLENTEFVQVYVIVTFMWILTIINELRLVLQFAAAVSQMPIAENEEDGVLRQDGEEYQILAFTRAAKFTGLVCTVYRLFISSFITWVGCQFLLWTQTNIDLILNALALTFILELDRITYKAAISRSRQNLIGKLKQFTWRDPSSFARRHMNTTKICMMFCVIGAGIGITYGLRAVQREAYMDMFALAASICLYQGPTPGYWSQFRSTFPAPGLCETVLDLKCETPIVGEKGVPCVEDWTQRLCKFYIQTDSPFSTWSSVDFPQQGACMHEAHGGRLYAVKDLVLGDPGSTFSILASACQAMWQQEPRVTFRNRNREATGPRTRVYPYKDYMPAGPFWCNYEQGTEQVLTESRPAPFRTWRRGLGNCADSVLAYTDTQKDTWQATEQAANNQEDNAEVRNITKANGSFSGFWGSKELGVVIITNQGSKATITNPTLPYGRAEATVNGNNLQMTSAPGYSGELQEDGKIHLFKGDGDVDILVRIFR